MKKLIEQNFEVISGTSYHNLELHCSLDVLIEKLGQPSYVGSGDNKVQLHWAFFEFDNDGEHQVITIYDWKEYGKSINQINEWHIGSKNITKDEIKNFIAKKDLEQYLVDLNPNRG
ncbi:MAG: hypothetical protein WC755_07440 [Candidatus Woesearchaeota archaeon]|jgi:hypothetical protein